MSTIKGKIKKIRQTYRDLPLNQVNENYTTNIKWTKIISPKKLYPSTKERWKKSVGDDRATDRWRKYLMMNKNYSSNQNQATIDTSRFQK